MSDKRDESGDESEFGLGMGMLDSGNRANRILDTPAPGGDLKEIYALPKTFDGAVNGVPLGDVSTTPVPRLLPGETEADRG